MASPPRLFRDALQDILNEYFVGSEGWTSARVVHMWAQAVNDLDEEYEMVSQDPSSSVSAIYDMLDSASYFIDKIDDRHLFTFSTERAKKFETLEIIQQCLQELLHLSPNSVVNQMHLTTTSQYLGAALVRLNCVKTHNVTRSE